MSLQTSASSGNPLTLLEIDTEFGGPAVPKLTDFYKAGGYVPPHQCNSTVPTSGRINVLDFLGRDVVFRCVMTTGYALTGDGNGSFYSGYSSSPSFGFSLGTQSGNSTIGLANNSVNTCTPAALYTLAAWNNKLSQYEYYTIFAVASSTDFSNGTTYPWTNIIITPTSPSGSPVTLIRSSATPPTFDGSYTRWTWNDTIVFNFGTNYTVNLELNVV